MARKWISPFNIALPLEMPNVNLSLRDGRFLRFKTYGRVVVGEYQERAPQRTSTGPVSYERWAQAEDLKEMNCN